MIASQKILINIKLTALNHSILLQYLQKVIKIRSN